MDTTTGHDARQQVIAAIELPSLDGLAEAQVRGMTCVWDGIALTPETAVDLGPRTKKWLGSEYQWYPRGCRRCVGDKAYIALFTHAHECAECLKGPDCPFAVEVRRLLREGAR